LICNIWIQDSGQYQDSKIGNYARTLGEESASCASVQSDVQSENAELVSSAVGRNGKNGNISRTSGKDRYARELLVKNISL